MLSPSAPPPRHLFSQGSPDKCRAQRNCGRSTRSTPRPCTRTVLDSTVFRFGSRCSVHSWPFIALLSPQRHRPGPTSTVRSSADPIRFGDIPDCTDHDVGAESDKPFSASQLRGSPPSVTVISSVFRCECMDAVAQSARTHRVIKSGTSIVGRERQGPKSLACGLKSVVGNIKPLTSEGRSKARKSLRRLPRRTLPILTSTSTIEVSGSTETSDHHHQHLRSLNNADDKRVQALVLFASDQNS